MDESQLLDLAESAIKIRIEIYEKAEKHVKQNQVQIVDDASKRSRRGQKHSTPKSNIEGLLESEIKERDQKLEPVGKKFKLRTRCQLKYADSIDIIHAHLVEHKTHAEVARQF